jgi:hypothetical protein
MCLLRQEQRLRLKRSIVEQSDRAQRLRVRQRLQEQIPAVPLNSLSRLGANIRGRSDVF